MLVNKVELVTEKETANDEMQRIRSYEAGSFVTHASPSSWP
jgi:hypothetical protein